VADYIASADVGIVPLPDIEWWRTSSPLKLMEYLAAGKPVIVSRIAAHTAVLGDCPCACYLDRVSPEAIADGVRYFYGRRSELARLGSFGQQIVIQRYSWAAQARKLVDYLSTRTVRTGELAGSRVRDRYRQ
jgi:glycosyltransferase involved in cell wall biosynthesis